MPAWAAHLPTGIDPADVDLSSGGTLTRRWLQHWKAEPSRAALFDDDHGWLSASELEVRSRQVAGRLAAAGLNDGDRIVVSADTSVPLVVALVACLRLNLVVVPANTAYQERELAHLVSDASPVAAIVDDATRGRWLTAAAGNSQFLVLGTDVDLPDGPDPGRLDASTPGDPALIAYTSGTTGAPKGAVLRHANLLASAEALALAWRWSTEDRLVLALPLFHLHGLGVGLFGTLAAGASVVLRRGFSVDDVATSVLHHQATLFFGVPTMWSRLAASEQLAALRGLRLGVSGSAPLPAELHAAIELACGQRVIERYGMTETVMNVSNPYDGERRPGTVGLALPGVEVRLAPDSDEILLRGPNVFDGYWQRPDATSEAFADGWFSSGDVGAFDVDGYLRIIGRCKELIITGGYNVYPREVEDVLRGHPAVSDAAVIGISDGDWGERVIAVLEGPGTSDDADAILAHAAADLAAYKRPQQVIFVDALPRNALGKVVKASVVAMVADGV